MVPMVKPNSNLNSNPKLEDMSTTPMSVHPSNPPSNQFGEIHLHKPTTCKLFVFGPNLRQHIRWIIIGVHILIENLVFYHIFNIMIPYINMFRLER